MIRTAFLVATIACVLALSTGVSAQGSAQSPASPPAIARALDRSDLRHQIYVMEGALARAVSFGAQRLNREIRSVVPEMVALSGEPQARGVYLEGYGVFFDVGVPILHQSMVWSLRTMLGQDDKGLAAALKTLKDGVKRLDGTSRVALESAIARLELQLGPMVDLTGSDVGVPTVRSQSVNDAPAVSASGTPESRNPAASTALQGLIDKRYFHDPNAINRAYTEAVQRALVDAMIDYSPPMAIGADEFLTVGARDNMQRDSLAPPDPYEEVVTILLRIKGSDLAAYRAAQIDRDEVRKRVQVREF